MSGETGFNGLAFSEVIVIQSGNVPSEFPAYTLAADVLAWSEEYLTQPDGENAGEPWRFTDEQIRFLAHWFSVGSDGRWIYRSGSLRRAKGWGKSPLLAALCIIEFCGPCRFSHFGADGQPLGQREHSPWVQIAATSLDQCENTMALVRGMLVASPLVQEEGLDIGLTRIQFRDGRPGKIEPVTANSTSLEGGRPTFACLDEVHVWTESNSGHKVARVLDRNIRKNKGGRARYLETTNSYDPRQDSIAQRTHEAVQGGAKAILYDCIEASPIDHLKDEALLRQRLKEAYGDSTWVDLDSIIAAIQDPRTPPGEAYRFYLNQVRESAEAWISKTAWDACRDDDDPIRPRDQIAIGFDGSLYDDATSLVGARMRDAKLFVLGVWESDGSPGWEVDTKAVDACLFKAFREFRVAWMYADPYCWQDVIDRWAAEFGDKIVYRFPTNREKPMAEATERFHTAVVTGQLKHDGNPDLQRHVLNAVTREVRAGYVICKEKPKSKRKIDLAVAAILAHEARGDAIADGRLRIRPKKIMGL